MADALNSTWTPAGGVAVLTFSRIARDRRVQRQCELLAELGYRPVVVAYASPGDTLPFPFEPMLPPSSTMVNRLQRMTRQVPAHLGLAAARTGFWVEPRHRQAIAALNSHRPGLVIANDWPALVVAAEYKRQSGAFLHYDTHEFATLEFDESAWWRFVYKPMVTQLERAHIDAADSVSTVGPRLAEALQAHYCLIERPAVVRNIPDRIDLPCPVPPSWPLRILYHGQVLPDRGLETLIDSIAMWQAPHTLTIRGDGNNRYIAGLKQRAVRTGRAELVTFEAAVQPDQVMPMAAATADLGVHFTPLGTDQRHFSMPNKLFEYIGSGLAVAVSPGADLKRLVEAFGVGVVSRNTDADGAAAAINSLTPDSVAVFKSAAREAARILCWENERSALRAVIDPYLAQLCPAPAV
jgi:glycosyltransferase involved in cell wall biosynthesis